MSEVFQLCLSEIISCAITGFSNNLLMHLLTNSCKHKWSLKVDISVNYMLQLSHSPHHHDDVSFGCWEDYAHISYVREKSFNFGCK